jgi:hypothetical protein
MGNSEHHVSEKENSDGREAERAGADTDPKQNEEPSSSSEPEYRFELLNDLIVYGVIIALFTAVLSVLILPYVALLILVGLIAGYFIWRSSVLSHYRREKNKAVRSLMEGYEIEDDPAQFMIRPQDRERGGTREKRYRKKYKLILLEEFGNRCCRCGARKQGLDLDHFFMPKKKGGTFAMWHKDGFWVNNAIPLCQTCNRSKGKKSHTTYFDQEKLMQIMDVNQRMTRRLNDDQFLGQGPEEIEGIDPSGVEVSDEVMQEPNTSVFAYMQSAIERVVGLAGTIKGTGKAIGDFIHGYIVKPSLVWWIELKLNQKIVLSLTVGCIAFVLSLFLFGT